ncbi:uncharacterized protein LACBIDRAFT_297079 [Laccaria bicolor S238N-H82]|uniref:Predicted protein n=1 Tax=Laccaria bicolor (strain S238N-H82 / ATCC MYA-4686) TaxID=486041 RepID=B0D9Y6_LACBS|nr:uncharacterized protein LACBIDRAFT_297079 [Laccaria bicolor S238N-H82]EDR08668.1 predicted protein [Laccaria bicolor S238N-H82]|eukprot:XP_001880893.1 predicted protein [Laccaria bicolor S238N-H82]
MRSCEFKGGSAGFYTTTDISMLERQGNYRALVRVPTWCPPPPTNNMCSY